MKELQILSPDGTSQMVPLAGDRLCLGRSAAAELSYPNDSGLSRQHTLFEREGDAWTIVDLGSKNGTTLNGHPLTAKTALKSGDRIMAGHMIVIVDGMTARAPAPVVIFDSDLEESSAGGATVITSLESIMQADEKARATPQGEPSGLASTQVAALIRAGNELSGNRPLPDLFRFILDLAIDAVKGARGILLTLEDGELVPRANRGEGFRISSAVRSRVLETGASVLVCDTSVDEDLRERRSIVEQNVRSLIAVPLQTGKEIIGIIYVDSPSILRPFTRDDLNLLTVMANVAAVRIEHTRLAEMERARQIMARDLDQAAEIQQGYLPSVAPGVPGLDLAGHNAPCRTVGGDYYDFFPYEGGRVAMVLGDVSGKGMPASLLMMGLQARMQALAEEPSDIASVITRLNRLTCANCPANRFITLFFCLLDGETGELVYCNAGHNPPVLLRADGKRELLRGGGPVVGIIPEMEYSEYRNKLEPGDTLLIYSDGVTEAANAEDEEFETERLVETIRLSRHLAAPQIVERIRMAVAAHAAGAPQSDDITIIAAKRVSK
ncbi:MAG TPA: SpoIIE family protein phosphatase [Bryobacteraceae bacterium]|nr:SpoIIE family protein phosphatase [Bryobacteraceae bacterium]